MDTWINKIYITLKHIYKHAMVKRTTPEKYFNEIQDTTSIPNWVPIILAIALIGSFSVALYAISRVK